MSIDDDLVPLVRELLADASIKAQAGELQSARRALDRALTALHEVADPSSPEALGRWIAAALRNKMVIAQKEDRYEEGLALAGEIVRRFAHDVPSEFPFLVGDALMRQAFFLRRLDRFSETLDVYSAFVARFENSSDPAIRIKVAAALVAQEEQLVRDARYSDAIEVADGILARFSGDPDGALAGHLADAVCKKAEALGRLGLWSDAIDLDDMAIAWKHDRTGGAWPLVHKAHSLTHLGREDEARATWAEVVEQFSSNGSPDVEQLVADAVHRLQASA